MLQAQIVEYKMAHPAISVPRSHCLDLRDQVLLLVPGRSGKSPRRSRKQDDALTRVEPEVPPHRIVESSQLKAGEHRHGPIPVSHSIRRYCTPCVRKERIEGRDVCCDRLSPVHGCRSPRFVQRTTEQKHGYQIAQSAVLNIEPRGAQLPR